VRPALKPKPDLTSNRDGTVTASTPPLRRPSLTSDIQTRLGRELRAVYSGLESEPLPDRLVDLLRKLEEALPAGSAVSPELRDEMLATIPNLRAFAISLTNNRDAADDIVQETILKGWANMHRFQPGTNMQAWLFTILRNLFHSQWRKRRHEVEDPDEAFASKLQIIPEQPGHVALQDLRAALERLSPDQREALILVGAEGLSYEETAQICGVAVGTIKSRVNRARNRLAELLAVTDMEDLGPDRLTRAALVV
jgi:RNA polymerase sigma-70 factor (ECF subfamily)